MIGREDTGTLSTNYMRAFRTSISKAETEFKECTRTPPAPALLPVSAGTKATKLKLPQFRGLHSPTFRLNVSDFCGIGVTFRRWLGSV